MTVLPRSGLHLYDPFNLITSTEALSSIRRGGPACNPRNLGKWGKKTASWIPAWATDLIKYIKHKKGLEKQLNAKALGSLPRTTEKPHGQERLQHLNLQGHNPSIIESKFNTNKTQIESIPD